MQSATGISCWCARNGCSVSRRFAARSHGGMENYEQRWPCPNDGSTRKGSRNTSTRTERKLEGGAYPDQLCTMSTTLDELATEIRSEEGVAKLPACPLPGIETWSSGHSRECLRKYGTASQRGSETMQQRPNDIVVPCVQRRLKAIHQP